MSQQIVFDLLRVGSWGQLQEWKNDVDDRKNDHRRVSHPFALHPGRQISIAATPTLAEAARVSLEARGDGGTGRSKPRRSTSGLSSTTATAHTKLLGEQLRSSTLSNLFDTRPPFQIDGNFGQSQGGAFELLPAQWSSGDVRGLRTRGRLSINIKWQDRSLIEATMRPSIAGLAKLRVASLCGQINVARSFPCRTHGLNARSWRKAASTILLRRGTSQ